MSDGTVGVKQATAPDRLIDNVLVVNDQGDLVYRQRVDVADAASFSQQGTQLQILSELAQKLEAGDPVSLRVQGVDVTAANPLPTAGRFTDENGAPYNATNPLPVDVGGSINVESMTVTYESIISTVNSPVAPLAAGETFTGTWEEVKNYAAIVGSIFSDAPSAVNGVVAEFSEDGATPIRSIATTYPGGTGVVFILPAEARYFRVRYVNGATPQTTFRTQLTYKFATPALVQQSLAAPITDANIGAIVKAHLAGRRTTGQWASVAVNDSGHVRTETATLTGAWSYVAGTSGSITIAAGRRVIGLSAHTTDGGSITINGGDTIPLPANGSISLQPYGNLVAPSIVFTGTTSYMVETLG